MFAGRVSNFLLRQKPTSFQDLSNKNNYSCSPKHLPTKTNEHDLKDVIKDAKQLTAFSKNTLYYHVRDPKQWYVAMDIVLLEKNEEPAMVYKALYGEQLTWVRPVGEWIKKFRLVESETLE